MHVKSVERSKVLPLVWFGSLESGVPAQVSSLSLDYGSKLRGPSPISPRVAEQCNVNIHSLTHFNFKENSTAFTAFTALFDNIKAF
ncbi:hypothetical protein TNCV_3722841 [Trichonephila clavipes]|nr:hypothetical protein TNCV_3722841 [Trichonephila clavipes]